MKLEKMLVNFLSIPFIPPLFLARKIFNIKFIRLRSSRIGHLAANPEIFFRRRQLGLIDNKIKPVGIATTRPCNEQLLTMLKRNFPVIRIPHSRYLRRITKVMATKSILRKLDLFDEPLFDSNEYYEFTRGHPHLKFTPEEEDRGKELLQSLKVDNWYICFHSRDSAYLNKEWKKGDGYNNYRNSDINNYLEAVHYITGQGGHALRMGIKVEKNLPPSKNDKIIDYSSLHRTDFGDIYLPAKCKFFLGDGCGINQVAQIFNTPVAWANVNFIKYPPFNSQDMFILKKIWSFQKNRFLTFKEIINSEIFDYLGSEKYREAKLKLVENSPEEILDLVVEMNQRLDGTWKTTEEDEMLQHKYKSLFPKGCHCYGFPSRIGSSFLKSNQELLN